MRARSCFGAAATAAEQAPPFDWLTRRLFFFGGVDIARDTAFGWSGIVAPFAHLDEDGTRIRIFGGHGRYRYDTGAVPVSHFARTPARELELS